MYDVWSTRQQRKFKRFVLCIDAHKSKAYHLGLGINISKNNLAKANENEIGESMLNMPILLIAQARKECISDDFELDLEGNVYAFDSSVIDLCLNIFWWAKFRKAKGAIKMHTLFDVKTSIPCFIHITEASVHDVNTLDELNTKRKAFMF